MAKKKLQARKPAKPIKQIPFKVAMRLMVESANREIEALQQWQKMLERAGVTINQFAKLGTVDAVADWAGVTRERQAAAVDWFELRKMITDAVTVKVNQRIGDSWGDWDRDHRWNPQAATSSGNSKSETVRIAMVVRLLADGSRDIDRKTIKSMLQRNGREILRVKNADVCRKIDLIDSLETGGRREFASFLRTQWNMPKNK